MNKDFHYAKECELFVFGFNDGAFTSLIPVVILVTCKKDNDNEESIESVTLILKTILDKYGELKLAKRIRPYWWPSTLAELHTFARNVESS